MQEHHQVQGRHPSQGPASPKVMHTCFLEDTDCSNFSLPEQIAKFKLERKKAKQKPQTHSDHESRQQIFFPFKVTLINTINASSPYFSH